MRFVDIDYITEDGEPRICIFARDEDGRRVVSTKSFEPYFYYKDESGDYETIFGDSVSKKTLRHPKQVPNERSKHLEVFEGDIPFTKRFLIDKGIKDSFKVENGDIEPKEEVDDVEYRKLYIDFEMLIEGSISPEDPEGPICLIGIYDTYNEEFESFVLESEDTYEHEDNVHCFEKEEVMLAKFIDRVSEIDPDIIVGYNIEEFDFPYFINRCKKLRVNCGALSPIGKVYVGSYDEATVVGRPIFDVFKAYKKMISKELSSHTLDSCCNEEDVIIYDGRKDYEEMLVNGELVDYNRMHCLRGVMGLDYKLNMFEFFSKLRSFVGCEFDDLMHNSKIVDVLLLRKVHGEYVLPSKKYEDHETFEGGLNEAHPGYYENVVGLDLSAYYPNIIRSMNISPETKDSEGDIVVGDVRFRSDKRGVLADLIDGLIKLRQKYKRKMKENYTKTLDLEQRAVKIVTNSIYGVLTKKNFRLYDRDCGASVTRVGREVLEYSCSIVEDNGCEVIYKDTDGFKFINDEYDNKSLEEIKEESDRIADIINSKYGQYVSNKYNVYDNYFNIEFDGVYEKLLILTSKRYIGIRGGGIDKKGLDLVRSDRSELGKEAMKRAVSLVFNGDIDNFDTLNREMIREMENMPLEKIGISSKLSKKPEEYEVESAHLKAYNYSNEHLGSDLRPHQRFYRIWVKSTPDHLPRTDVVAYTGEEDLSGFEIDYDRIGRKQIVKNINKIAKAVGKEVDYISNDQKTIGGFANV